MTDVVDLLARGVLVGVAGGRPGACLSAVLARAVALSMVWL